MCDVRGLRQCAGVHSEGRPSLRDFGNALRCDQSGSGSDAEAVDAYCAEHGLVLPGALRRQLLDQNGGVPSGDVWVALPAAAVPLNDSRNGFLAVLAG